MCFLTFASKEGSHRVSGAVFLVLIIISQASGRCWNGWIPYNNSCYLFPNVYADWFEAQFQCVTSFGGYLAEINNSDENTFIKNEARINHAADGGNNKWGYWIGGSDMEMEGFWLWMKSRKQFHFTDWSGTEPNNSAGHEDCAFLYAVQSFLWYDIGCSTKMYFVCEKPNLPEQTEIIG